VFPAWLREPPGRPRICVSWGTTLGNLGLDRMRHVPELVRALGSADVEIVLAVLDEHRELFTELPRNVVAVGPVALDLVLPTCDALVHQSGAGTSMTALIHGVPQLLVPTVPEQVFNAQRLVPAGAARCVPSGEQAEQEEIRAALKSILADEECRRAAQELSRTMRAQPTPAEVVSVIEKVAADG
jgi:UDP:flavonoid glycosyltransferase YjiC (YdhE family)